MGPSFLNTITISAIFGASGCIGFMDTQPSLSATSHHLIGRLETRDGLVDLTVGTVAALEVGGGQVYAEIDRDLLERDAADE